MTCVWGRHGGTITEVAAAALGWEIPLTVIVPEARVMERVFPPEVSAWMQAQSAVATAFRPPDIFWYTTPRMLYTVGERKMLAFRMSRSTFSLFWTIPEFHGRIYQRHLEWSIRK